MYSKSSSDWSEGLKRLVSTAQHGNPILFGYFFTRGDKYLGHEIVIKGYEAASDGGHNIIAYDNRSPKRNVIIKVDKDYSSCVVDGTENATSIEFTENMSAFDYIDIDGPNNNYTSFVSAGSGSVSSNRAASNEGLVEVSVWSKGKVTMVNTEGKTLIIENDRYSGSVDVANRHMIVCATEAGEDRSYFSYYVPKSSVYTFEAENGECYVSVRSEDFYGCANTNGADKIVISLADGVQALGNEFDYDLSVSVNNSLCDLMSITGSTDQDVKLALTGDKVKATGVDGESGTVTVISNDIDVDKYTYLKGYQSILVSRDSVSDDVSIMGSSKENGVFDVEIGSRANNSPNSFDEDDIYPSVSNEQSSGSDSQSPWAIYIIVAAALIIVLIIVIVIIAVKRKK